MAIDYTTAIGQVRLLTADLDEANFIMPDEMVQGYLTLQGENVRLAAADALDAIATTESLMSKKLRTQDVATDGPAVAADLRKKASDLRDKEAEEGSYFEIIPMFSSPLEGEEWKL